MGVEIELETAAADVAHCPCPSCGQREKSTFYEMSHAPAHSCLLMADRTEAIEYPRGEIRLTFCPACGFIANALYDSRLQEYSPRYEETQHFSKRFDRFARDLSVRLIEKYDLHGKQVLEIGCGKGEFLAAFCELGQNRGIGIDPSCDLRRLPAEVSSRVTFIRDYYSEKYSHLTADLICCRHTLEHIQPVRDFLETIRRSIADRLDTLVFFEVPDVTRILREAAFWDVYYEHCSYFSLGTLARLFRLCRFDILEIRRDFDDQYLWVMARPCRGTSSAHLEIEDDLAELARDVNEFRSTHSQRIRQWRERFCEISGSGRRLTVWGAGSKCVSFLTTLGITTEIQYVVDINPHKQGKYLPGTGHQVVKPEFLKEYRPEIVVLMNPIYCGEVRQHLDAMGVAADLIPV